MFLGGLEWFWKHFEQFWTNFFLYDFRPFLAWLARALKTAKSGPDKKSKFAQKVGWNDPSMPSYESCALILWIVTPTCQADPKQPAPLI